MSEKHPSLKDFEYFPDESDNSLGDVDRFFVEEDHVSDTVPLQQPIRPKRWREIRQFLVSVAFFAVAAWISWGYRDHIAYAFSAERSPHRLGSVVGLSRDALVHNQYVEVEGVTMHRGLVQSLVRSIGFEREELHYFELAGSRGVFVEASPDRGIRFASAVKVSGRVVDPKRTSTYDSLLQEYEARFHQPRRPFERIVQVGVSPGSGRTRFIALFAFLFAMAALNIWILVRVVRSWRYRS